MVLGGVAQPGWSVCPARRRSLAQIRHGAPPLRFVAKTSERVAQPGWSTSLIRMRTRVQIPPRSQCQTALGAVCADESEDAVREAGPPPLRVPRPTDSGGSPTSRTSGSGWRCSSTGRAMCSPFPGEALPETLVRVQPPLLIWGCGAARERTGLRGRWRPARGAISAAPPRRGQRSGGPLDDFWRGGRVWLKAPFWKGGSGRLSARRFESCSLRSKAGVAELADAPGSKPGDPFGSWEFKSPRPHHFSHLRRVGSVGGGRRGSVAQLGERLREAQEAGGSIPS